MHLQMNCCDQALTRDMNCHVKHILSNQKCNLCANRGRHVKSAKWFVPTAMSEYSNDTVTVTIVSSFTPSPRKNSAACCRLRRNFNLESITLSAGTHFSSQNETGGNFGGGKGKRIVNDRKCRRTCF